MRRGFTLIEIAIVLVVVGLMTAFGLQFFGSNDEHCAQKTHEQLKTIEAAMQRFIATHSRLPKPARMDEGSSNPRFGYEAMGAITDPTLAAYATDVPAGITNAGSNVLIGALPHVTLELSSENAADCWGDKFTYAVTNGLTSSDSMVGYPSTASGAIILNSGTLTVPQLLSANASYVVVSHGMDKYGATAQSAGNAAANHCNGSAEPKIDRENCNSDAIFYSSTRNTGETDQHFDDLVIFSAKLLSTEPCAAQTVSWSGCSGPMAEIPHGTTVAVNNTAGGLSGTVDVKCTDGAITQSSPVCTPSGACAAGWSDTYVFSHEGYMGDCTAYTLTIGNCTSGTGGTTPSDTGNADDCVDHITGAGPCTVHNRICGCLNDGVDHTSYGVDGSNPTLCCNGDPDANGLCGNQAATCDNDASDGLTGGLKYCAGTVIDSGGGNIVCSGGIWGASYPYSCNMALCQSGSANSDILQDTSGCPGSPDCSGGDTLPMPNCSESATCTCN